MIEHPDQQSKVSQHQQRQKTDADFRLQIGVLAQHQAQRTAQDCDQRRCDHQPVTCRNRRSDHGLGKIDGNGRTGHVA